MQRHNYRIENIGLREGIKISGRGGEKYDEPGENPTRFVRV